MGDLSLIEQLKTETRVCPQCGLQVRHPFVERCPRCFAGLPRLPVSCPGCVHRMTCPVRDMAGETSMRKAGDAAATKK